MANRSYLCATNVDTIYPSADKNYDSNEQTIAHDVYRVPLLWLALFREKDMRSSVLEASGGPATFEAPIARREQALANLRDALPFLNELFRQEGRLDTYVAYLHRAVEDAPYQYLTIELEEIAWLANSVHDFFDLVRSALTSFDAARNVGAMSGWWFKRKAKARLMELAGFENLERFPPAELLLHGHLMDAAQESDQLNHSAIIGSGGCAGIGRYVPWEQPPRARR